MRIWTIWHMIGGTLAVLLWFISMWKLINLYERYLERKDESEEP